MSITSKSRLMPEDQEELDLFLEFMAWTRTKESDPTTFLEWKAMKETESNA